VTHFTLQRSKSMMFCEEGKQVGLLSEVRNPAGSVPKELMEHGLLGRAVIVSAQQTPLSTGSEDDPLHVCVFTIEVALAGVRRFTATCRQAVAASLLPKLMLSDVVVPVRVDPDDRSYVVCRSASNCRLFGGAAPGARNPVLG
jgi:hypothetical protein